MTIFTKDIHYSFQKKTYLLGFRPFNFALFSFEIVNSICVEYVRSKVML